MVYKLQGSITKHLVFKGFRIVQIIIGLDHGKTVLKPCSNHIITWGIFSNSKILF